MVPFSIFNNNGEAAHAVSDCARRIQPSRRFTVRPYNFYEPETTEWWLVPSTDWPAYHHGKLFAWKTPPYSSVPWFLYLGYYVEQGLSEDLRGMPDVRKTRL